MLSYTPRSPSAFCSACRTPACPTERLCQALNPQRADSPARSPVHSSHTPGSRGLPCPQLLQSFCKRSLEEPPPLRAKHRLQPGPPKLGREAETSSISGGELRSCVHATSDRYLANRFFFSPLHNEKVQIVHGHIRNVRSFTSEKHREGHL